MLARHPRQYVFPPVGQVPDVASENSPTLPAILAELSSWVVVQESPLPQYPGVTAADMAEACKKALAGRAARAAEGYDPDN
jgi:hypothetical protein